MARYQDRSPDAIRDMSVEVDWSPHAEGSCLVTAGSTRILCTASVEETVPRWREERGEGWVTAEYAMLPRATHTRNSRERDGARGRTQEIQRLIGRALRSVVDFHALGPRTITVDCDVLQADGGTRTASITGGWVALFLACDSLMRAGAIRHHPLTGGVAAVSVGVVDGESLLDLDYAEDVRAQVDMNVVATHDGRLVEVQGTAEGDPFPRVAMDEMMDLALAGVVRLARVQREALQRAMPSRAAAGTEPR
ncbi:MAG: ribonuclease PH [Gemmatimonadales bacterium]|nr:MAG: ribonuclease PH [Gemmatimonadales bacterium]